MYHPMPTAPTPVSAWVNAAVKLAAEGDELHGLMLHIENPASFLPGEAEVVSRVDKFLRDAGEFGVASVSNTIFPASLDRGDGIEALTKRYLQVYGRRMCRQGGWGRYFERMVAWKSAVNPVNQLEHVIGSLRDMKQGRARFFENITEIAIFDPQRDLRKKTNRQCLSFIELKPDRSTGTLHMMAVYRNHYYIQRTLGNLIGLGRLLAFISKETGFEVGTLTIQSTHACLKGFKKSSMHELIKACADDHKEIAA